MKRWQAVMGMILVFFYLAGCAATAPVAVKPPEIPDAPLPGRPPEPAAAPPAASLPPAPLADRDQLLEGIAALARGGETDLSAARGIFAALVENHPRSRWRPAAETLMGLIDGGRRAREQMGQERLLKERALAERTRALQENDQLRKAVRDLTERLQAETAALTQENDQLKSDLQRLKTLEIELQRRERMLR